MSPSKGAGPQGRRGRRGQHQQRPRGGHEARPRFKPSSLRQIHPAAKGQTQLCAGPLRGLAQAPGGPGRPPRNMGGQSFAVGPIGMNQDRARLRIEAGAMLPNLLVEQLNRRAGPFGKHVHHPANHRLGRLFPRLGFVERHKPEVAGRAVTGLHQHPKHKAVETDDRLRAITPRPLDDRLRQPRLGQREGQGGHPEARFGPMAAHLRGADAEFLIGQNRGLAKEDEADPAVAPLPGFVPGPHDQAEVVDRGAVKQEIGRNGRADDSLAERHDGKEFPVDALQQFRPKVLREDNALDAAREKHARKMRAVPKIGDVEELEAVAEIVRVLATLLESHQPVVIGEVDVGQGQALAPARAAKAMTGQRREERVGTVAQGVAGFLDFLPG